MAYWSSLQRSWSRNKYACNQVIKNIQVISKKMKATPTRYYELYMSSFKAFNVQKRSYRANL